jgi:hypothetical protein
MRLSTESASRRQSGCRVSARCEDPSDGRRMPSLPPRRKTFVVECVEEVQVVLGHASRTTTERYAHLAPDSIRRVANEAIEQWSDDSEVARGLVNDWSTPISPYTQVPEKIEPPIRVELMTYGLRNRCSNEEILCAFRSRTNSWRLGCSILPGFPPERFEERRAFDETACRDEQFLQGIGAAPFSLFRRA